MSFTAAIDVVLGWVQQMRSDKKMITSFRDNFSRKQRVIGKTHRK